MTFSASLAWETDLQHVPKADRLHGFAPTVCWSGVSGHERLEQPISNMAALALLVAFDEGLALSGYSRQALRAPSVPINGVIYSDSSSRSFAGIWEDAAS